MKLKRHKKRRPKIDHKNTKSEATKYKQKISKALKMAKQSNMSQKKRQAAVHITVE